MRPGSLTWMPSKSYLPNRSTAPLRGTWGAGGAGGAAGAAGAAAGASGAAGVGMASIAGSGPAAALSVGGTAGAGSGGGAVGVGFSSSICATLPHGLFLAPADHFVQRDVVDLDDLETDAGQVAVRAAHAAADALDEDFVVLVDEVDR